MTHQAPYHTTRIIPLPYEKDGSYYCVYSNRVHKGPTPSGPWTPIDPPGPPPRWYRRTLNYLADFFRRS